SRLSSSARVVRGPLSNNIGVVCRVRGTHIDPLASWSRNRPSRNGRGRREIGVTRLMTDGRDRISIAGLKLTHGAITMRRNQIWVAILGALTVGLGPVVAQQ